MKKFILSKFLLIFLVTLQSNAFATTLNCKFISSKIDGVQTLKITDESLFINEETEIPLGKSVVRCAHFGRQTRFDGNASGYQVILDTCTSEASLAGNMIDNIKLKSAEVICNKEE